MKNLSAHLLLTLLASSSIAVSTAHAQQSGWEGNRACPNGVPAINGNCPQGRFSGIPNIIVTASRLWTGNSYLISLAIRQMSTSDLHSLAAAPSGFVASAVRSAGYTPHSEEHIKDIQEDAKEEIAKRKRAEEVVVVEQQKSKALKIVDAAVKNALKHVENISIVGVSQEDLKPLERGLKRSMRDWQEKRKKEIEEMEQVDDADYTDLAELLIQSTLAAIAVASALYDLFTLTAYDTPNCSGKSETYLDGYYVAILATSGQVLDLATIAEQERAKVVAKMRSAGFLSYRALRIGQCQRI